MSTVFRAILQSAQDFESLDLGEAAYSVVDMHTAGEPLRVILNGVPKLISKSVLGKRMEMKSSHDHIRQLLMYEPRGHRDMYGCILVEPEHPDSDFGIIFMHNEGYSTMCGHAIIAITKLAAMLRWKPVKEDYLNLKIDAPCGQIISTLNIKDSGDFQISFEGVPSFLLMNDLSLNLRGFGTISYDIAYGGAFYAYVDADLIGLSLEPSKISEIIRLSKLIKAHIINSNIAIDHPSEVDLSFLYGVIFRSQHTTSVAQYRNVCVFADGEVDRSPTGSGLCGFLALLYHKEMIINDEEVIIESIVGSKFRGKVRSGISYHELRAVIPEVSGNAHVISSQRIFLQNDDPFTKGFLLR